MKSALTLAIALFAGPALADPQAALVQRQQYFRYGLKEIWAAGQVSFAEKADYYRRTGEIEQDPAMVARVERVYQRVRDAAAGLSSYARHVPWGMLVVNTDHGAALMHGGGKLVVYSGYVRNTGLTDDELAFAVAHEVAHALREHPGEIVSQVDKSDYEYDFPLTAANAGSLLSNRHAVSARLATFRRMIEREADLLALPLMACAGFDPRAALSYMEKAASSEVASAGGANHDAPAARRAAMDAWLNSTRYTCPG